MGKIECGKAQLIVIMREASFGIRKILCFIIAFLSSLLLVGVAVCIALRWNISFDRISNVLENSNYYMNRLQEMESDLKIITLPTGLGLDILDGVVIENELTEDIKLQLLNAFQNGELQSDAEKMKSRLKDNLNQYLEKKGVSSDKEVSQYVNNYINSVSNWYGNSLKIPLMDYMIRWVNEHRMLYSLVLPVMIGLILIMMLLLYRWNSFRGFIFFAYSSSLAAALMLAVIWRVMIAKISSGLQVTPDSLKLFLGEYLKAISYSLFNLSMLFLLLSLVLLLATRVSKYKVLPKLGKQYGNNVQG